MALVLHKGLTSLVCRYINHFEEKWILLGCVMCHLYCRQLDTNVWSAYVICIVDDTIDLFTSFNVARYSNVWLSCVGLSLWGLQLLILIKCKYSTHNTTIYLTPTIILFCLFYVRYDFLLMYAFLYIFDLLFYLLSFVYMMYDWCRWCMNWK